MSIEGRKGAELDLDSEAVARAVFAERADMSVDREAMRRSWEKMLVEREVVLRYAIVEAREMAVDGSQLERLGARSFRISGREKTHGAAD